MEKKINNNIILKDNKIIRYIGIYVFFIAFFIFLYLIFKDNLIFLNDLTAKTLSSLLNILGIESTYRGQIVMVSDFSFNIIDECTGLYEILVYSACVLAYPTSVNKKVIGIAIGTPFLIVINMSRMLFLTFIGIWYTNLFSFFHYIVWQITLIIFVAIVLMLWIFKVVKR
jgi:archaeosortase B (VPXXXP-CTERM-specific)